MLYNLDPQVPFQVMSGTTSPTDTAVLTAKHWPKQTTQLLLFTMNSEFTSNVPARQQGTQLYLLQK